MKAKLNREKKGNCGRNVSQIVIRYGKYRMKVR
jgi:hypothetical protein